MYLVKNVLSDKAYNTWFKKFYNIKKTNDDFQCEFSEFRGIVCVEILGKGQIRYDITVFENLIIIL